MAIADNYYTVVEAAAELSVTRQTIYRWIKNGVIKAETIGRETLIEKTEVSRYKEGKISDWLYEVFNITQDKKNFETIRKYFGYDKTDKIERMGGMTSLDYIVYRKNKETEIVSIKNLSVSINRKTGHLMTSIDPKDITRELMKDYAKKINESKEPRLKSGL